MKRRAASSALASALVLVSATYTAVHPAWAADGEIHAEKIVGGLRQAVSFAFDQAGRIWFVEKAVGDVRIFDPATGGIGRFFKVPDVFAEAEQGLVGIALPPGFPDPPFVYVYGTRIVDGSLRDQLIRIRDTRDHGTDMEILWDSAASAHHQHSGGRLLFGPDGMLYLTVGDALDPGRAQDSESDRGKILRITPSPRRAAANPIAGTRVFAYGSRNSFGIAFDPETGSLWETENGPACNDEINRVDPGANLGWGPSGACVTPNDPMSTNRDGPRPVPPQLSFTPPIAPTGIAFCEGCGLGDDSEGALFFGSYNTGSIHRAILDEGRENIVKETVVATAPQIALSLEVGPDHAIYFSSYIAIFRLQLRGKPAPTTTPSPASHSATPPSSVEAPAPPQPKTGIARNVVIGIGLAVAGGLFLLLVVARGAAGRRRNPPDRGT